MSWRGEFKEDLARMRELVYAYFILHLSDGFIESSTHQDVFALREADV